MAKKPAHKASGAPSPKVQKPATKLSSAAAPKQPKAAVTGAQQKAAPADTQQQQQAAAGGKAKQAGGGGSEIDDLFGALKGKGPKKATVAAAAAASAREQPVSKTKQKWGPQKDAAPKLTGSKDDMFGTEAAAARKRTEEGFAVYTEEELGLGRAGGGSTDKCPFDCECCF